MLSAVTIGAAASKKCSCSAPKNSVIFALNASLVRGPDAITVLSLKSREVTSSSTTSMFSFSFMTRVTSAENFSRSTASAPPAGTAFSYAQRITRLSSSFSSSFSSPTAFFTQRVRTAEFAKIVTRMSGGALGRFHLEKADFYAPFRKLVSRFASRKARADYISLLHSLFSRFLRCNHTRDFRRQRFCLSF